MVILIVIEIKILLEKFSLKSIQLIFRFVSRPGGRAPLGLLCLLQTWGWDVKAW